MLMHAQRDLEAKAEALQHTSHQMTELWSKAEEERSKAEQEVLPTFRHPLACPVHDRWTSTLHLYNTTAAIQTCVCVHRQRSGFSPAPCFAFCRAGRSCWHRVNRSC